MYNQATLHNHVQLHTYVAIAYFMQVYDLKAEVSQLKSSKMHLSNELRKLKDKYHSLSQEFKKSVFLDEAEDIMGHLEEMLIEVKSRFETLPRLEKLKVELASIGICVLCNRYIASYVHMLAS